jgi:hypothetical protein
MHDETPEPRFVHLANLMLHQGSKIPASSNASTASAVHWVQRRTGFELSMREPLRFSWGPKSFEISKHCSFSSLF